MTSYWNLENSMVFCFSNCLVLLWGKRFLWLRKTFEAKGFEFTKTINLNNERSEQFLKRNKFLTCYWRFLRSKTLKHLKCQLDQMACRNLQKEVRKDFFFNVTIAHFDSNLEIDTHGWAWTWVCIRSFTIVPLCRSQF